MYVNNNFWDIRVKINVQNMLMWTKRDQCSRKVSDILLLCMYMCIKCVCACALAHSLSLSLSLLIGHLQYLKLYASIFWYMKLSLIFMCSNLLIWSVMVQDTRLQIWGTLMNTNYSFSLSKVCYMPIFQLATRSCLSFYPVNWLVESNVNRISVLSRFYS